MARLMRSEKRRTPPSNQDRQAAYRQRHLYDVETVDSARLHMIVPISTKRALERLALRYGVTQRAMLARLLDDAERAATAELSSADLRRYFEG